MTISSTTTRNQYTGNNSTTVFAYSFKIFADADLKVILTDTSGVETVKTLTTHYTVSGAGTDSGGNVTFTSGNTPGTNVIVTILRNTAITQSTDYVENDTFPAAAHETALDRLTAIDQHQQDRIDRSLKAPDSEASGYSMTLPAKATRLGTVLGFNATSGNPEAGPKIADVSSLAAITADISTLADIEDGTNATNAIQTVAGQASNIASLGPVSGNIATLGTSDAVSDMNTLASISSNISTVAGISSSVSSVAGVSSLLSSDFISDLNTLATSDIVTDLNLLATSQVVADMAALAGSGGAPNVSTVNISNITLTDNSSTALQIKEGSNNYLTFDTTNSSEQVSLGTTSNQLTFVVNGSFNQPGPFSNTTFTSKVYSASQLISTNGVVTIQSHASDKSEILLSGGASDDSGVIGQTTITSGLIDFVGNIRVVGRSGSGNGNTAIGDNAGIKYTATEGLILTGQGSTNDVTIKNKSDADVLEIVTGTTNVTIAGNLGVGGTVTGTGTSVFASLDISGDIDVDGRVLIGQSASTGSTNADELVVGSGSGNQGITIFSGASNGSTLAFKDSGANEDGFISYNHGSQFMQFGTAEAERARLDQYGNLGINCTPNNYSTNHRTITLNAITTPLVDLEVNGTRTGSFVASSTKVDLNAVTSVPIRFLTADVERMRLTPAGRLGIGTGTDAPQKTLDVRGELAISNSTTSYWNINRDDSDGSLTLTDTNISERLRLTTAGILGVGVSDTSTFSLGKAIQIGVKENSLWGEGDYAFHMIQNSYYNGGWKYTHTDEATRYSQEDGEHIWRYAPSGTANAALTWSEAMRISKAGSLGLGETDPDRHLHVKSGTDNVVAKFESTDSVASIEFVDSVGSAEIGAEGNSLVFFPAGAEKMRLDAGGSMLLGETTPTDLHNTWNHIIIGDKGSIISQNGSGGIDGMTISSNAYIDADTGGYSYITTDEATKITQENGKISFNYAASGTAGTAISFDTSMTIDSSGNLLVGMTSDGLTSAGIGLVPNAVSHMYSAGNGTNATLMLGRGGNDGNILSFNRSGTPVGSLSANGGVLAVGNNNTGGIIFGYSGSHTFIEPSNTSGAATDDLATLGSDTKRFRDLYLSGGLYVGGTGAANKLDDYEEGTYEATLSPSTSGTITLNASYNLLSYTKVGRLVTVTGRVRVSSVSSPVGFSANLSLPFANQTGSEESGRITGTVIVAYAAQPMNAYGIHPTTNGVSYVNITRIDASTFPTNSAQDFSGDEHIGIMVTYMTA